MKLIDKLITIRIFFKCQCYLLSNLLQSRSWSSAICFLSSSMTFSMTVVEMCDNCSSWVDWVMSLLSKSFRECHWPHIREFVEKLISHSSHPLFAFSAISQQQSLPLTSRVTSIHILISSTFQQYLLSLENSCYIGAIIMQLESDQMGYWDWVW